MSEYEKAYEILKGILINTSKDKILNSKINFDFSEINDPTKEVNYDKIIAYGF